jgi:hypothetical protein
LNIEGRIGEILEVAHVVELRMREEYPKESHAFVA